MNYKIVRICDSAALSVIPREPVRFDIERCGKILEAQGLEVDELGVMVTASLGGVEITLYPNGRLMLYPASDKKEAARIADQFYSLISGGIEGPQG